MRLIDADKLQERAYQMRFGARITDGGLALINYLLSEEPTVDPVKHGRWITSTCVINNGTKSRPKAYMECKCSVCGGVFGRVSDLFCYRCGAKMDGENYEE